MTKLVKKIILLFPPSFALWVYTFLLKPKLLRALANSILKSIIPASVNIGEGTLLLNPADAAVSGQLALGVYENFESDFFRSQIKEGMTIVDLGANIGYYTLIAAQHTGAGGKVLAYEPEPENYALLVKNIKSNGLIHVTPIKTAISNSSGTQKLYLTEDNKGTHSLVDNRQTGNSITVETDTLDNSLIIHNSPAIDVLKMDIEGAELLALEGMKKTITRSPNLIIFTEFYPKGIARFGRSPREFLDTLNQYNFSLSIIDEDRKELIPLAPNDFDSFIHSFSDKAEPNKNLYGVRKLT